jgi:hypothetical protein
VDTRTSDRETAPAASQIEDHTPTGTSARYRKTTGSSATEGTMNKSMREKKKKFEATGAANVAYKIMNKKLAEQIKGKIEAGEDNADSTQEIWDSFSGIILHGLIEAYMTGSIDFCFTDHADV